MGEESPENWSDEWRRAGRVVFPARRRPAWWRLGFVVAVGSLNPAFSFGHWLERGGLHIVFGLLGVAGYAVVAGGLIWQLVTQRPVLIVDHEGIRVGRKQFLPWTDISAIGIPTGPKFFMLLPVLPKDIWAKHLKIPQDNAKDLPALARWLEEVLQERRQSRIT